MDLPMERILFASSRLMNDGTMDVRRVYFSLHSLSSGLVSSAATKNSLKGSSSTPTDTQLRIISKMG